MSETKPQFNRILLKISGEALTGKNSNGISPEIVQYIAREVKEIRDLNVDVGIVVGGGNFIRGEMVSQNGIDRVTGDYMGMLATIINSMALVDAFEKEGLTSRLQTAIHVQSVAEPLIRRKALNHLSKGRVVVFAAGTGNPYFSTDTAGVLRAMEIGAQIIFKATKVDGIYDKDPEKFKDAVLLNKISFKEACDNQNIRVMDKTAFTLCMENKLPIRVFNLMQKGNLKKAIFNDSLGTLVNEGG